MLSFKSMAIIIYFFIFIISSHIKYVSTYILEIASQADPNTRLMHGPGPLVHDQRPIYIRKEVAFLERQLWL